MATDVLVPTLGESITEATLGQWLKKPGDPVKADEPIASLETDKVAVEVPAPVGGDDGRAGRGRRRHGRGRRADRPDRDRRRRSGQDRERRSRPRPKPRATSIRPARARLRPPRTTRPRRIAEDQGDANMLTLSPAVRRAVLEHQLDPSQDQGHRQGRPPDQGRRARRRQGRRQAQPAPAAKATPAERSQAHRRRQPCRRAPARPASAARSGCG